MLELMITVIVAAILVALALPSFREAAIRSNVTQLNNQLVLALQSARSEAIRRGTWVEVVSANASNNWSTQGWSVVADTNFDHQFTTDATTGGGTINKFAAAPTGFTVCGRASAATGIGGDSLVVFSPSGTLTQATQFDFNVNRPDGNTSLVQHITVTGSGEVRSVRGNPAGAPTGC